MSGILLTIAIAVSAFCHATILSFLRACIESAFVSTALLQLAAYIEFGVLDPLFPSAIVTGAYYALIISILVGLFRRLIRQHPTPSPTSSNAERSCPNDSDDVSE